MDNRPPSIPDRPALLLNEGKQIAPIFVEALRRWRKDMSTVFSEDANKNAQWPPEDPIQVFRQFSKRPPMVKELGLELAAVLLEIEAYKGKFGDKVLYPHQQSQIAWTVMELLESGNSYLIENAPGTGKTAVLGAIMQALTRLQIRGILKGNVVYGTQRPFHLAQQTFSPAHRNMRIAEEPTVLECNLEWEYVQKVLGKQMTDAIGVQTWRESRQECFHDAGKAPGMLEAFLRKSGMQSQLEEHSDSAAIKAQLIEMLSGSTHMVWDIDELPMPLHAGKPVSDTEAEGLYFSGDLGHGIPPEFLRDGQVLSRRGMDIPGEDMHKGVKNPDSAKVVLTSVNSILYANQRRSVAGLLEKTAAVIVDDGRTATTAFQDAIAEVRGGNRNDLPLIFMASALGTTNGIASRPYADRVSLRLTIEEAIDRGVLPNVGADIFPAGNEPIYPSGTKQALEQLVAAHFAEFELPSAIGQPQPRECNTLLVIDAPSIDATVKRLRAEYERQGIPATVLSFRSNKKRRTNFGNTKPPYSERAFNWMLHGEQRENEEEVVRILVSAPKDVSDAVSLTNLQNVTLGTGKGVGREALLRLFGRLEHSNLHREAGSDFRGYFRQGLYKETQISATIFHLLRHTIDIKDKDALAWTPLQVLHGTEAAEQDAHRTLGMRKVMVPLTHKGLEKRARQEGTSHDQESRNIISRIGGNGHSNSVNCVKQNAIWKTLVDKSRSLQWDDPSDRQTHAENVLEAVFSVAPTFMQEARPAWEQVFRERMSLGMSFEHMVGLVAQRMEAALLLGTAHDRAREHALSVPKLQPLKSENSEETGTSEVGWQTDDDLTDDEFSSKAVLLPEEMPEDEILDDYDPEGVWADYYTQEQ